MKRLLSIALTFAIMLTTLPCMQIFAAEPAVSTEDEFQIATLNTSPLTGDADEPIDDGEATLPFTDVFPDHWFYDDVQYVYDNGIMNGTGNNLFSPDRTLTRGEVVTVLYRLSGSPEVVGECVFTDVPSDAYYYNPVVWATENGIVNGTTPTTFCPTDAITREQIATIFYRYYTVYLELEASDTGDLTAFPDHQTVNDYAYEAVCWAVGSELMRGVASGETVRLNPLDTTNRAQLAALLRRLCAMEGVPANGSGNDGDNGGDDGGNGNDDDNGNEDENPCRASDRIIEFIKIREGFYANPYWDYGQWTTGYGTCCKDSEGNRVTSKGDEHKIADRYKNLTPEAAEALLYEALIEDYEPAIEKFEDKHGLTFTQNQFDAMVDFTFNLGSAWTSSSYKISRLLSGTDEYADGYTELEFMDALGAWCRVGGVVMPGTCNRRMREASIFLYGDYDYETARFCFVRYKGNGSYLTTSSSSGNSYTDAVDYYIIGEPYGQLMEPVWAPADSEDTSEKVFLGWYTDLEDESTLVTAETIATENCTLYAKWGDA